MTPSWRGSGGAATVGNILAAFPDLKTISHDLFL
jgi:hypothetical protein